MAVLHAFCDESEVRENGARVLAVVGAIGEPEAWGYFKEPWNGVLSLNQVPYFRASEFENRQGPYKDWNNGQRLAFHSSLIEVIGESMVIAFGAALLLDDYDALAPEAREALGTPYELCAQWAVRNVGYLLAKEPWKHVYGEDQVFFVFEEVPPGSGIGRLSEAFERSLKERPERRLAGKPIWAKKADFVELQVADMFAYEVAKDALRVSGASERETRRSIAALAQRTTGQMYLFNRPRLDHLVKHGITDISEPDLPIPEDEKVSASDGGSPQPPPSEPGESS